MTIGGVPPLINKPWFINPVLTLSHERRLQEWLNPILDQLLIKQNIWMIHNDSTYLSHS
jgi:hypothetical protein